MEVNLKEASPQPVSPWEGRDTGAEAGLDLHRSLGLKKITGLALRLPQWIFLPGWKCPCASLLGVCRDYEASFCCLNGGL